MSTSPIVPRWEWRCFAPSLAMLAQAASLPADVAPCDSDETYLLDLSGRCAENVKLRDGMLDVKHLRQTDAAGLELWEPVLKARFPLGRKDVAAVFESCQAQATLTREAYTRQQLIEDIVALQPALRIVELHKSRRAFSFAGCLAELAQITAGSVSLESFALEHEDPQHLFAALQILGLDSHANTNYILGLKRALGLEHAAA